MDQIRFDFLNTQAITARNQQPAHADGADAFAQILDQQLAKAKDAALQQRSQDSSRPVEDWRRPADATSDHQDTARSKVAGRRRDDKTAAATNTATAAKPKAAQKPATASAKAGAAKTIDTTKTGPACDAARSDDGDDKKDTAVTAQSASDNTTPNKTAAENQTANNPDPNGQQQQDQNEDGQTTTPQPDADAPSDVDLAALMVPLPLQTISTPASAKANVLVGGGASTPALQAALLAAASLNAGALNIAGGPDGQAQTPAPGLKFGAILPSPTLVQTKTGADATTATTADADAADPAANAPDPSDAISSFHATPKPQAGTSAGTASTKPRSTATAFSPVANAYAGQSGATTTPTIDPRAVQPWAVSNIVAGTSEDTLAAPAVSSDAEPSSWSQYLDAGVGGTGSPAISARTAAFLAQLKQNVQAPPPHEQIAIQIQKAMQNGSTRLTVNLEPAELGRVEVKLDMDKDKNVTATIVVDRPATLDLLQRDAKQLERALQDAGLQTNDGSLSFSLRNSAGQGGGQGAHGQAGAGIGGQNARAQAQEAANQPARADVIATADGYVDLET